MDWFVDEYGNEWFVGEEMEVRVLDPIDGWQFYGVYDTTRRKLLRHLRVPS